MQLTNTLSKHRLFLILILLGLLIRIICISFPGFKIDVDDWFSWSIRLNEVGYSKFYSTQIFSDYTPGYMYILSFLGDIRNLLHIDPQTFYLLLKVPAIIAEMLLGIFVYWILCKYSTLFYSLLGASFILLNPAFIFNSTVWGQIDSLLALFLLITIYYLKNKRLTLSSILLGISFLIKPQTIAIFPIYCLYVYKNFSIKNLIKIILPFLFTIFIFSLPFFNNNPFYGLISLVINTASQYPYTSLFAYNLWGIIGFWIPDSLLWNNLSYQMWGYILLGTYWIIIGYFYLRRNLSLYALATLATLGFFFLPTKVHERYIYPALVFLILLATLYKSKLLLALTGTLSLLHFLNLYYVYVYYNEFYLKLPKILYVPAIYNFLEANGKGLSLISTVIFILISIGIIKYNAIFSKD